MIGKTQADIDVEAAAELRELTNQEALRYLSETDWYVIREADTSEAVPDEVRRLRAAAREKIVHGGERGKADIDTAR